MDVKSSPRSWVVMQEKERPKGSKTFRLRLWLCLLFGFGLLLVAFRNNLIVYQSLVFEDDGQNMLGNSGQQPLPMLESFARSNTATSSPPPQQMKAVALATTIARQQRAIQASQQQEHQGKDDEPHQSLDHFELQSSDCHHPLHLLPQSRPTFDIQPPHSKETYNASQFVDNYCDFQNQTISSWYPDGSEKWQQRFPYFALIGAKKAGTTSFATHLNKHPNITFGPKKELLFFLPTDGKSKTFLNPKNSQKIMVEDARHQLLEDVLKLGKGKVRRNNRHQLYVMDATPGYLFHSTYAPHQMLCVCPWIKLLVILRNPIERTWSNYNFLKDRSRKGQYDNTTFEDWIYQDLSNLQRYGLIKYDDNSYSSTNKHDDDGTTTTKSSYENWRRYTSDGKASRIEAIGRGFYALQLQHWFNALREMGREPKDSILIVRLEDITYRRPNGHQEEHDRGKDIFDRVVKWLGLPHFELLEEKQDFSHAMTTNYNKLGAPIMDPKTRSLLESFYKPYNKQLSKLLGQEWDGVWDASVTDPSKVFVWP